MRDTRSTWIRPGSRPAAVRKAAGAEAEAGARLVPWAASNPYRLVIGFAAAAEARGARIFERTEVTKVTFDRVRATVVTPNGRIVTPRSCTPPASRRGSLRA